MSVPPAPPVPSQPATTDEGLVSTTPSTITALLRDALNQGERLRLSNYLHPDVHWHNPHGQGVDYHGRTQVLACYARLHAQGTRTAVEETFTYPQAVVLGLRTCPAQDAPPTPTAEGLLLYQVFHIADGLITHIDGFSDRYAALDAAYADFTRPPQPLCEGGQ